MSDRVGTPNCCFSHAKAHICDRLTAVFTIEGVSEEHG